MDYPLLENFEVLYPCACVEQDDFLIAIDKLALEQDAKRRQTCGTFGRNEQSFTRADLIDGSRCEPGDIVLGLPSSGLHANGFTLVRSLVGDGDFDADLLLPPTRLYLEDVRRLRGQTDVRALAHVTGGGIMGNLPRVLPPGRRVFLRRGSWPIPPVFGWLERLGNIEAAEMDRVFNQGIGFVMIVSPYFAESIQRQLNDERVPTFVIGDVREGEAGVEFV